MATPTQIQEAAVSHLKENLAGLKTCELYAGEFAGGEIRRTSLKAPGVLVACLDCKRERTVETEAYEFKCFFAAYCLTKNAAGREERAVLASALAESVLAEIEGSRFGLTGLKPAKVTRLQNLYSAAFDKASVAIWAVTWEQVCRMGPDVWAEEGTRPDEIYLGYAPDIGIPHEEDYEQIDEEPV